MSYEIGAGVEATAYKWSSSSDNYVYRGLVLPCDVRIPPATIIRAGCSLDTLLKALAVAGRQTHFASGMSAGTAETGTGSVHEGAGREASPNPSPSGAPNGQE